jgi:SH3-like domain-containing protein
MPVTPAMAPAGSEHHATRRLPMRAAPDGAARILASIDSGTEVHVLRAEGPWRYVASAGGRSEGWVDGTYLAGEASTPLRAPAARQPAPQREAIALLAPFSPTQARQAPAAQPTATRTRLPPAAISGQ